MEEIHVKFLFDDAIDLENKIRMIRSFRKSLDEKKNLTKTRKEMQELYPSFDFMFEKINEKFRDPLNTDVIYKIEPKRVN